MSAFADQLLTDLDVFLNAGEFAVTADLGEGALPRLISVIVDALPDLVEGETAGVRTTRREALCKTADLAGTAVGHTMIIGETEYEIIDLQPDGTGLTTAVLKAVG